MPSISIEEKIAEEIEKEGLFTEGTIHLPLVFHIHQPVGNFPWVFEFAYKKSYEPLLAALERHPTVSAGLHITGPVLDWLETNQPSYIKRLESLVTKQQVELLGGGYYEPILAVIPDRDKLAQIQLMTKRLQELVGATPRGFWLAERAWEPHLPAILVKGDIEYVLIDDNHIRACGIEEPELFHVFATEDQGKVIAVFPINEQIRYLTPWKPALETYKYLQDLVSDDDPERVVTSIDDAEKFGVWPAGDRTTYDICYGAGYDGYPWIDQWFGFLEQLPWVISSTPGEFLSKFRPQRLLYLPTVSYDKMDRWALPTPARREVEKLVDDLEWGRIFSVDINEEKTDVNKIIRSHIKGGYWRHFLVKYPEANRMHKRMLLARKKLLMAEKTKGCSPKFLIAPWDEIYKAQCNDVFWHGLFAGVYYQFLRRETYRHIINAEKLIETELSPQYPLISEADVEFPRYPETIIENQALKVFIKPNDGCVVQEIDLKAETENVSCVLTRREEAYHEDKSKLHLDKWQKASFRDWILPKSVQTEHLLQGKISDNYGITSAIYSRDSQEHGNVCFSSHFQKNGVMFSLTKDFSLDSKSAELAIAYKVSADQASDDWVHSCMLITEICLVLGDSSESVRLEKSQRELRLSDDQSGLAAEITCKKGELMAFGPIETILKSEGEWQPSYQGHSIFLSCPLQILSESKPWMISLRFKKNR
ncbi:MAG: alpha-amylase/4-alpha-glucanotransferase domain-containing protein [Candidatus Thorarchaeota archaeon]